VAKRVLYQALLAASAFGLYHGYDQGWERTVITGYAFFIYSIAYIYERKIGRTAPVSIAYVSALHCINNLVAITPMMIAN